ncbi:MAG: hypothetical protein Q7U02_15420 [Desulfosalsimonadaceae bacterium]|nr:hypothetical protein [Desulfosalsimonadaceae bacterium]
MTENEKNGHNGETSHSSGNTQADQDIIELSEIAIGITPEDDAIVELTEDIIGEAFFGFSKATSDKMDKDESELDLSEKRQTDGLTDQPDDTYRPPSALSSSAGLTGSLKTETDLQEDDISRQLDNYFGAEEESLRKHKQDIPPAISGTSDEEEVPAVAPAPSIIQETRPVSDISITAGQLDEALERVIRKLYAEKINRILDVMVERTVTEEISQLKDYLIGIAEKKD